MSDDILRGVYDLHLHSAPSIFPRFQDDVAFVRAAAKFGLGGVVIKAHEGSTAERAALMNAIQNEVKVFGSLVLNWFVGGLNPDAVEVALQLGAKIVWFPTIHSARHLAHFGAPTYSALPTSLSTSRPVKPISIFDEQGNVRPEVYEIVDLIAQKNAILATGHLSTAEVMALVSLARERGAERVIATHPDFVLTRMSLEDQAHLCRLGAFVEKTALTHWPDWENLAYEHFVHHLRALGPSQVLVSSDLGQRDSGEPCSGYVTFLQGLLSAGVDEAVLERVTRETPRQLLG